MPYLESDGVSMTNTTERDDVTSDPRTARQATAYGDDADAYLDLWAPVLLPLTTRLLDMLPLGDAGLVLDIGTGVGAAVGAIGARAPSAHVVGIDRSIGMLRLAPLRGRRAVMDAMNLAIASETVDVVVAAFMLFHLPEPSLGLREIRRVMRGGGAVGIATWGEDADVPAWNVWIEELDAHGAAPRDADSWILNRELMDTPDKLERSLLQEGFSSPEIEVVPLGFKPDPEAFTELQVRFSSRRRLESLSPAVRADCIARAIDRTAKLGPEDFADDSEVLLATAARAPRSRST